MKTHVLAFLIGALIAGLGGWFAQGWRMGEKLSDAHAKNAQEQTEIADQHVENIRHVLKAERANHVQIATAHQAARQREHTLRRDAAVTRSELDRLRDASASAVRASRESHAACLERATALGDVFDQCAARYGELAEAAGRHASDIRALIDSWPRDVPRVADSLAVKQE